jgi:hypothetical protein
LALLVFGPLALAVTAPRAGSGAVCCQPRYSALWLAGAFVVLAAGAVLLGFAITRPAESQLFFRHVCRFLPGSVQT